MRGLHILPQENGFRLILVEDEKIMGEDFVDYLRPEFSWIRKKTHATKHSTTEELGYNIIQWKPKGEKREKLSVGGQT